MVGNNMYTNSGTYYDTLVGSNGCDSTVTTNLTVLSAAYPTIFGVFLIVLLYLEAILF